MAAAAAPKMRSMLFLDQHQHDMDPWGKPLARACSKPAVTLTPLSRRKPGVTLPQLSRAPPQGVLLHAHAHAVRTHTRVP